MFLDLGPGLGRPLTYLICSLFFFFFFFNKGPYILTFFNRALGPKPVVLPKL